MDLLLTTWPGPGRDDGLLLAADRSAAVQEQAETIAPLLKADPLRLRLMSLITSHPGGEARVCEVNDALDLSQPTISHHLKALYDSGLLDRESAAAGSTTAPAPRPWPAPPHRSATRHSEPARHELAPSRGEQPTGRAGRVHRVMAATAKKVASPPAPQPATSQAPPARSAVLMVKKSATPIIRGAA
jgi:hypothetical protein